jgi:hypothetical protein
VPVPVGLDGDPLGLEAEPLGDVLLDGGVDGVVDGEGDVADGGDADGVRSAGRSPTRSVRDSLQAVSKPAPSARTHRPVSIFLMRGASSLVGCADQPSRCNAHAANRALTGCVTTITNAVIRAEEETR